MKYWCVSGSDVAASALQCAPSAITVCNWKISVVFQSFKHGFHSQRLRDQPPSSAWHCWISCQAWWPCEYSSQFRSAFSVRRSWRNRSPRRPWKRTSHYLTVEGARLWSAQKTSWVRKGQDSAYRKHRPRNDRLNCWDPATQLVPTKKDQWRKV